MAHLRTKRKTPAQKLNKLITSIFLVFISMYALLELGNFLKAQAESVSVSMQNNRFSIVKKTSENTSENTIENTLENMQKNTQEKIDKVVDVKEEDSYIKGEAFLITKNGDKIFVEIVDTDESRNKGLSGKTALNFYEEPNGKIFSEGMLFIFDEEKTTNFWMKDMNFDLDIIWLDKDFKIVHIEQALADSYNSYTPEASQIFTNGKALAKYVLEVNIDAAKMLNLKIGDSLKME